MLHLEYNRSRGGSFTAVFYDNFTVKCYAALTPIKKEIAIHYLITQLAGIVSVACKVLQIFYYYNVFTV